MEIKNIFEIEIEGAASTLDAIDFIPQYTEAVSKFLRDHQSSMGNEWVKQTAGKLYKLTKNNEGTVLGSSSDIGAFIATYTKIPLITGQQLLSFYEQGENKNPFGNVYIDFGVQINGLPKVNKYQAETLLKDLSDREIEIGEGRVPNFSQLRLIADKESDSGLAYRLADNVENSEDVSQTSAYPFLFVGKDGLFRAYLCRDAWDACVDILSYFSDDGRVVRYDAEGVVPAKKERDLVSELTGKFIRKF